MRMFLAALLLSLATPAQAAEGDAIPGPFTAADGDTLVTAEGQRLRLAAVSAPEMDTRDGWLARGALDDLLDSNPVTCTDTGQRSYKRPVVICETADGRDLGAALIGQGWAVAYRTYLDGHPLADTYRLREAAARQKGKGLWANGNSRDWLAMLATPIAIFVGAIIALTGAMWNARATRHAADRNAEASRQAVAEQIRHAAIQAQDDRHVASRENHRRTARQRAELAQALSGEVEALLNILQERGYHHDFVTAANHFEVEATLDGNKPTDSPIPQFRVGQDYFTVYRATANQLGNLHHPAAREVATFYTLAAGLVDGQRRPGPGRRHVGRRPRRQAVQHVQHPLAERLGPRRAGEHGDQMRPAWGEDADAGSPHRHHGRHILGEFVSVPPVNLARAAVPRLF